MTDNSKTIYLAAAYSRRLEMYNYAVLLEGQGHRVNAEWVVGHDIPKGASETEADRMRAEFALADWQDIANSQLLVCFTGNDKRKRGGRHVEFGLGLNNCDQCVVVGPRENVFHYLPCVKQFDTFEEFFVWLNEDVES